MLASEERLSSMELVTTVTVNSFCDW